MKRHQTSAWITLSLFLLFGLGWSALGQSQKPAVDKMVGTWSLEVNAGNEYYYLILELASAEGKLNGKISELNGMFKDVPVSEVSFEGQTLKFSAKLPTPPDGAERVVKFEMKLVESKLEGSLTIQDLDMTVAVTGTKK